MTLDPLDRKVLSVVAAGLPLVPRPFAALADELGIEEMEVVARVRRLLESGVISRLGVVVRHHELGWRANAMTVWDVPDAQVRSAGLRLRELPFVTLCYRRPRRLPVWRYNLFCMVHGRDRRTVSRLVEDATLAARLEGLPREVLFSRRRFKQRGARYDDRSTPC